MQPRLWKRRKVDEKDPAAWSCKCTFPDCNHRTRKAHDLGRHMLTHTGEKPFSCRYGDCGFTCALLGGLSAHERTHTGERPYPCNYGDCSFRSATAKDLATHMRSHTGEKPYSCDFGDCGFTCSQVGNLAAHMMTHTGEKPYSCDFLSCGYMCAQSGNLASHMMTHTGEKPYSCDFLGCGYTCAQAYSLASHAKSHTDVKPYSCTFGDCKRKCRTAQDLFRHMRTHTGEKPYSCGIEECAYTCAQAGDLAKHKYCMHGLGGGPVCKRCKKRGVKLDTMSCRDCQREIGVTNRGVKEALFFKTMMDHKDVRLHDFARNVRGKSGKYPDGLKLVSGEYAVVCEVDEFGHVTYPADEEDAREQLIYAVDLVPCGIKYAHFFRFNPDQTRVSMMVTVDRLSELMDGPDPKVVMAYTECSGVPVGDKRPYIVEKHGW